MSALSVASRRCSSALSHQRGVVPAAALLLAAVLGGMALVNVRATASARHSIDERFQGQAQFAGHLIEGLLAASTANMSADLGERLGRGRITAPALARIARFGRFAGATVTDASGRPLVRMRGASNTSRWLRQAAAKLSAGRDAYAISDVRAGPGGRPVVGLAMRFGSAGRQRIFAGVVPARLFATVLDATLSHGSSVAGTRAFVVDSAGHALGESHRDLAPGAAVPLDRLRSELSAHAQARIAATPLRVVFLAHRDVLYAPVEGLHTTVVWIVLGIAGLAGCLGLALLARLLRADELRRRLVERLEHDAHHDALTGLVNRRLLFARARAGLDGAAMLYVDLDGFKAINDLHGHDVGDEVLTAAARRLTRAAPDAACVARVGGDEFALIVDAARVAGVCDALRRAMRAPILVDGRTFALRLSIGAAVARPGQGVEDVMRAADRAMYRDKQAARRSGRRARDASRMAAGAHA